MQGQSLNAEKNNLIKHPNVFDLFPTYKDHHEKNPVILSGAYSWFSSAPDKSMTSADSPTR